MVMWSLAALALFAAALTSNARAELKALNVFQEGARLEAASQAMVYLVAADLATNTDPPQIIEKSYHFENTESLVQIIPASGFIDLNHAPETLLTDFFTFLGGLNEADAQELARRVIVFRTPLGLTSTTDSSGSSSTALGLPVVSVDMTNTRHALLTVPEDLLQVPGMPFEMFDKIRNAVVTLQAGVGGVNPLCAPEPVLLVLAKGDASVAARIAEQRRQNAVGLDLTGLEQKHLALNIPSRVYRIDVAVPAGGEGAIIQRRWIELGTPGMPGLPVRTLRKDTPIRVPG